MPDKVTESSYYIENSNLIITSGKEGNVIDTDATIEVIKMLFQIFQILKSQLKWS